MIAAALKVLVIAVSLGLDVFAVSVGVGVRGVALPVKIRIGVAFAAAEVGMNLAGAGLGIAAGHAIGDVAGYFGFAALFALGSYMVFESFREAAARRPIDMSRGWGLLLASLSISLDSLGIGFSILYIGVPLVETLAVIAIVSVASTSAGLTLGKRLGRRIEERAELVGGILLAFTGVLFAVLKALHAG
ncbi:MAG TPA: manganese efflux pump [Candidatus Dormibacteraeota bacterium]|nr:manganese efflux pump [Candidatus Dormibacteraeota bacterium]